MDRSDFVLPVGTVTLLLLDVEGSTRLWERDPAKATAAIAELHGTLSECIGRCGGVQPVEQGEGDSAVAAFARASDAVACAAAIHAASPLAVRIGLHTGEVQLRDEGNYVGSVVNRCARIRDLGHGGQTLLSRATHDLVVDRVPMPLRDLGTHRLRDLARPEQVFQLGDDDFAPLRSLDVTPNNLPVQLTSFIGREQELGQIAKLLQDTRLLTVTGAGGCGKTRLALHAAADAVDDYPDGAWFVDFSAITDPDAVPATVAATLNLKESPGVAWIERVATFAKSRRLLLVLDNCEHVVRSSAQLADALLRACPDVTLLATSREPLGVGGEVTWLVPSLTVPAPERTPEPLETLTSYDAVKLFIDRAARARGGFTVTNESAPAVAQICQRLDGIPLAIELAAARVRMLSPQQIAAGLDDRFKLLGAGARTAVPRHQTLRASIDSSYDLLGGEERVLFRRLAVFHGTFDLDAVQDVCGSDGLDDLSSLVDRCLVVADQVGDVTRYRLLETIRQYALELLAESGERDDVRTKHLVHYRTFIEAIQPNLSADQRSGIVVVDRDIENLRAALQWSAESGRSEDGARICAGLLIYWYVRGRYREAEEWSERLAGATSLPTLARAGVLMAKAYFKLVTGHLRQAIADGEEALAIITRVGDRRLEAHARNVLAQAHALTDPVAAPPVASEALAVATEVGDPWCLAEVHFTLGIIPGLQGRWAEGAAMLRAGCVIAERAGNVDHLASLTSLLGWVAAIEGRLEEGERLACEGAAASRELRNVMWTVLGHCFASHTALLRGNVAGARAKIDAAAEAGPAGSLATGLYAATSAFVLIADGRPEDALAALAPQLARARETGNIVFVNSLLDASIRAYFAIRDHASTRAAIDEYFAYAQHVSSDFERGRATAALGRLALAEGDLVRAEDLLHDALRLHVATNDRLMIPETLESLAAIALSLESEFEAARLYGAAHTMRDEMDFRWLMPEPALRTRPEWDEGAAMSLDEVVAYAQRGRGERKRPSSGWASLTPTELDVVQLLSEGLTNARIAEKMFISPGTVKTHVQHIYTKLGVGSRSQVTAEAVRRGIGGA